MDQSRYFSNPFIDNPNLLLMTLQTWNPDECLQQATRIMERCLAHYESSFSSATSSLACGSLYCGALGARCYLRLRMAQRLRVTQPERSLELLQAAMHVAQSAVEHETQVIQQQPSPPRRRRQVRVTLLESPWVGTKAMLVVLLHQLGQDRHSIQRHVQELLEFLLVHGQSLPTSECDVLYGRAGALHAILFLRHELQDRTLGREVALALAFAILREGKATSQQQELAQSSLGLPLLWKWHDTFYLGAAHGVVGILQMLLSLHDDEIRQLSQHLGDDVPAMMRQTIDHLNNAWCFPSGNLKSSMDSPRHIDRLVHWCHGAPGHVLLLLRAADIWSEDAPWYEEQARRLGDQVLWPRGLLHKGVGLCHGMAGNAYALLALGRNDDTASTSLSSSWYQKACGFAWFALQHYTDLESLPDRPYSLFEGAAGLACLLLDLSQPDHAKHQSFPLYENRM